MPGEAFGQPGERATGRLDFGRATVADLQPFLAIMGILHQEPAASAFTRLLAKELRGDDYVVLAHLFEEISVLALHRLVSESLLFDAFAFDMYWDELREDMVNLRQRTANRKLCENFEVAAERARIYCAAFKAFRQGDDPARRGSRNPRPASPPPAPRQPSTDSPAQELSQPRRDAGERP
jgi:hypothetical protein